MPRASAGPHASPASARPREPVLSCRRGWWPGLKPHGALDARARCCFRAAEGRAASADPAPGRPLTRAVTITPRVDPHGLSSGLA